MEPQSQRDNTTSVYPEYGAGEYLWMSTDQSVFPLEPSAPEQRDHTTPLASYGTMDSYTLIPGSVQMSMHDLSQTSSVIYASPTGSPLLGHVYYTNPLPESMVESHNNPLLTENTMPTRDPSFRVSVDLSDAVALLDIKQSTDPVASCPSNARSPNPTLRIGTQPSNPAKPSISVTEPTPVGDGHNLPFRQLLFPQIDEFIAKHNAHLDEASEMLNPSHCDMGLQDDSWLSWTPRIPGSPVSADASFDVLSVRSVSPDHGNMGMLSDCHLGTSNTLAPTPAIRGRPRRVSEPLRASKDLLREFESEELSAPSERKPLRRSSSDRRNRSNSTAAQFVCQYPGCGKSFTRAYNLTSHSRTHTSERPFSCQHCGRRFARQHDRNRHEKLHLGIKPFACHVCHKTFARMDALNRHLRVDNGCGTVTSV